MRLMMLAVVATAALLSACSPTRRCESNQPYQSAQTLQPPGAVPGLTVPESPSALRIPPAPANAVPFGQHVDDPKEPGKSKYECLDMPPRMATAPEAPAVDGKAGNKAATPAPAPVAGQDEKK